MADKSISFSPAMATAVLTGQGDEQMANYIIIDAWTGYIWGDTRNIGGKSMSFDSIEDACRALDESNYYHGREYAQVSRLSGDQGYAVYRVAEDGSESVPVVHDGQYQDTIDAVTESCPLVGFVEYVGKGD